MADRVLTVVPTDAHAAPALPPEESGAPELAPDLLAALDRGDDAAVRAWIAAHLPEPESLMLYGLFVGAGVIGLIEWPSVVLSVIGQLVVDRRFGGVENVAAALRARIDALA